MKLILQTDVKNLGKTGDQVSVKKGFARNYLIPKGYAVLMNKNRLKAWEHQKVIIEAKKRKAISERQSLIEKLSSIKLKFEKEAQKDNRLFGSVTAHEISQSLEKLHKLSVDKRDIHFKELKTVGEHSVMIKLDSENQTEIKLSIKGIVRKAEYETQMDPQKLNQEAEKEKKDDNLLDAKKISDSETIQDTDTQLKPESLKEESNEKLEKEPVKKTEEENQEKATAKSSDAKENTNVNKSLDTASVKSSGAGKSLKEESTNIDDSESEYLNQQTEDIKETKDVKNLPDPKNDESKITTAVSNLKKEIKNPETLKQDAPKEEVKSKKYGLLKSLFRKN